MGIKDLNKIIKKFAENAITKDKIQKFGIKKVAIDANLYIYRFMYNNGQYIDSFVQQSIMLIMNNILPVYVWDGKPPDDKKKTIDDRKERAKNIKNKIDTIKDNIDSNNAETQDEIVQKSVDIEKLNKLEKQIIYVSYEDINKCKELFNIMGIPSIQANGEGDPFCAYLQKKGVVDAVATEDMDILPLGCSQLIRGLDGRKDEITMYNLNTILELCEITYSQFVDMCILCGCDYSEKIPGIGPMNAYKLIKKYEDIETIIIKHCNKCNKVKIPLYFNYKNARQIFKNYQEQDLNKYNFNLSNPNIDKLKIFLEENTKYRPKTLEKKINILQEYAQKQKE